MEKLKAEKFDVAIAEPFHFCGFGEVVFVLFITTFKGIFEELGIETVISAFSSTNLDIISYYIGEPSSISSMAAGRASGQKPTIAERIKAIITYSFRFWMSSSFANKEEKYLEAEYGTRYSGHGVFFF